MAQTKEAYTHAVNEKGQVFKKVYTNTAILGTSLPSNVFYVPITDTDSANFGPFNRIKIINRSANSLNVMFNNNTSTSELQSAGPSMITEWTEEDKINFSVIAVQNASSVNNIVAGDISVEIRRVN